MNKLIESSRIPAESKKKVCFVVPELGGGGAEKVLSMLISKLSREKFDLELMSLKFHAEHSGHLSEDVKYYSLGLKRVRLVFFKIVPFLRKIDAEILFVSNVNHLNLITFLIDFFLPGKFKIVSREPIIMNLFLKDYKYPLSKFLFLLHRNAYAKIDKIIALSQEMKNDLIQNFGVRESKIALINNPIDFGDIETKAREFEVSDNFDHIVVTVGRLIRRKGIHLIIEALGLNGRRDIKLYVIGGTSPEDPDYPHFLESLVEKLDIANQVEFTGFKTNPMPYIQKSSLMLMASAYEGFPNVAIEANALGVPILTFESPGGLKDMIVEGFNGWFVETGDVLSYSSTINKALSTKVDRDKIINRTKENYDIKSIIARYEQVLTEP